jgi:type I restriction enzyme S subunit
VSRPVITQTGGRDATEGLIEGDVALAVGMPTSAAPNGWRWIKLTDLSRLETGHTPSRQKPEYWDGDIPWIGIRDATANHGRTLLDTIQHVTQEGIDNSSARVLPANTVCLSRTASVGYVVVMGREMATSQDFVNWVCDESKLDHRFLKYVLLAENRSFARFSHGTTHQTIYFPEVKAFHVCVPSVNEQRAIANVLTSLDDKIEQNRRTVRALKELARATFKAWFVDFEPVKAKATGATSFPGVPPTAFAALPDRLIESPIGPAPQGWTLGKLGDHCGINELSVRVGQIDGEIEYIDIASVTEGRLDGVQRLPFAEAPSRARRRVRHGDTIWSCVRPNRRSYLFIHSPPENRIVSTGFAVLSPAAFGPSYLHELTTRQEFVDYLVSNADGSAYPAVRPEHFAVADILVPPAAMRDAFEEVTMPLRNLLAAGESESTLLATLRDYLLPRLLSASVRVSV